MNFQDFKNKYQKKEPEEFPHRVNSQPTLSVLVQTFQQNKYIQKCLDGILNQQTDFPFEILLGEDSSTDGTRNICIEYAEKYPEKIRLFLHHPENKIKILGTTTGNFNAFYNLFSAKGELLAFCEGDDLWRDPFKLQKQVDSLKGRPSIACTYHSFLEVNEQLESIPDETRLMQPEQNISEEDLKKLTFHPLLSTLCFRNFFREQIPEEMIEVINVDSFLLSLLGNYGEAAFIESIIPSFYRRHEGGVWSGSIKELKLKSKILTCKRLKQFYYTKGEYEMSKFYHLRIKNNYKALMYFYLKNRNASKFLRTLFYHEYSS
jgi:glycosyltransferase involved in cell wall biosynthesis